MIEVKHIDEVDVAGWPRSYVIRWASERVDITQLEKDVVSAIAKKCNMGSESIDRFGDLVCTNCAVNETAELIADYGPFRDGCLVNQYSNTLQFCGTFCESLEKLDETWSKYSCRIEPKNGASLADSIENCRKYILERFYPRGTFAESKSAFYGFS